MINYSEVLIINKYNKQYQASDVYDWNTFIFEPPSDKPSSSQINNMVYNMSLIACKTEAKKRIADYDWINDDTTTPKLTNKQDFYVYRSALRELILNPVANPVWPEIPTEVWGQ